MMTILIGMMLILLFLGCFIDQVSMMLITLPFFMPLVQRYGIDPVWFGVLFLICMQLGLLTPPFGLLLFTMKGVAPRHITMQEVYAAALPYVVFGLVILVLILPVPPIATWLPELISRSERRPHRSPWAMLIGTNAWLRGRTSPRRSTNSRQNTSESRRS